MTKVNEFGLERNIDAETAREVRRRSAFGCVVCGNIFCDYHHVEEYVSVDTHNADSIVLLCKSHHGDVTGSVSGRRISNETLKKYIDSPYGTIHGNNTWQNLNDVKGIRLGKFLFLETDVVLRIDEVDVISFRKIEGDFPIIGISAKFMDQNGSEVLRIEDNIVKGKANVWDFTQEGNTLQINSAPYKIDLKIVLHNDGILEISRLKMNYNGGQVEVKPNGDLITSFNGKVRSLVSEARIVGAEVGLKIREGKITFGKSERTLFASGASDLSQRRSYGRSVKSSETEASSGVISNNGLGKMDRRFDFKGRLAGRNIELKDMKYSSGTTAMEATENSIVIGKSNGKLISVTIGDLKVD